MYSQQAFFVSTALPEKLYRFFPIEEYAEDMVNGKFRLSTFNNCRQHEDPRQGDIGEASLSYSTGIAMGDSDDPELVEIARRAGINFSGNGGFSGVYMANNVRVTHVHDAYLLCLSKEFEPKSMTSTYGNYCVEITNVQRFFSRLNQHMFNEFGITNGISGDVKYMSREYRGLESPPDYPIELIKPTSYSLDNEFRFVYGSGSYQHELNYLSVESERIGRCCKRIL